MPDPPGRPRHHPARKFLPALIRTAPPLMLSYVVTAAVFRDELFPDFASRDSADLAIIGLLTALVLPALFGVGPVFLYAHRKRRLGNRTPPAWLLAGYFTYPYGVIALYSLPTLLIALLHAAAAGRGRRLWTYVEYGAVYVCLGAFGLGGVRLHFDARMIALYAVPAVLGQCLMLTAMDHVCRDALVDEP